MQLIKSFINGITELSHKYKNLILVDADNQTYTYSHYFQQAFRSRYYNLGNLESSIIPILAGMATAKLKIVFIDFEKRIIPQQINKIQKIICDIPLDVNFVGISSHQQQIQNQLLIPEQPLASICELKPLDVYTPANSIEALLTAKAIVTNSLPSYTSLTLSPLPHTSFLEEGTKLEPQIINSGDQIGLISYGIYSNYLLNLTEKLRSEKISVQLLHLPYLSDLNTKLIQQTINSCQKTFFVSNEKHLAQSLNLNCEQIQIPEEYFIHATPQTSLTNYLYKKVTSNY